MSALYRATQRDHIEVVQLLVKNGAFVDIRNKVTNYIR